MKLTATEYIILVILSMSLAAGAIGIYLAIAVVGKYMGWW